MSGVTLDGQIQNRGVAACRCGLAHEGPCAEIVVREYGRFRANEHTTELADGPPMPVARVVDKSDLIAVEAICGDVPALQIVWTDSDGHLPWDPDYANPPGSQRLLGLQAGS
jgi:hypothetical protein